MGYPSVDARAPQRKIKKREKENRENRNNFYSHLS